MVAFSSSLANVWQWPRGRYWLAAIMIDKPRTNRQTPEEIKSLLARSPMIKEACALDLLMFLHRHPRTFLTNEQLADFVGYEMTHIAKTVEAFIDGGIVERMTQTATHAARMYVLVLDGPQGGEGLRAILQLAATREGRRGILKVLTDHPSSPPTLGHD